MSGMAAIQAQYGGVCSACDEHFGVGTLIIRDDERNGWMHEVCPDPLSITGSVCPSCFTVQPCGCDE